MAQKTIITIQHTPLIKKRADEITIPDLWHIAERQDKPSQKAILDTWYLCHQLLEHIKEKRN